MMPDIAKTRPKDPPVPVGPSIVDPSTVESVGVNDSDSDGDVGLDLMTI